MGAALLGGMIHVRGEGEEDKAFEIMTTEEDGQEAGMKITRPASPVSMFL